MGPRAVVFSAQRSRDDGGCLGGAGLVPLAMFVGVARLTLLVAHSHSLKDKRAVVRRLRALVANEVGVTLREVAGADTWQRADLGFAVVGPDRADVDAQLARVVGLVVAHGQGEVAAVRREVLGFGDDWFAAATPYAKPTDADADASWLPAAWRDEGDPP